MEKDPGKKEREKEKKRERKEERKERKSSESQKNTIKTNNGKVLIKKKAIANNVECCNEFQENHRKMVIGSCVANY